METIMRRKVAIEAEFEEPLRDVVAGFAQMGYSMPLIADVLDVSTSSVKHYCSRNSIRTRRIIERRAVSPGRPGRMIRHNGREQSLTAWAYDLGLSVEGVRQRIRKRGRPD